MSDAPETPTPFKDAHVGEKVREAWHDPLVLAQLAAAIDPQAIREGNIQGPLERAQMLVWQAGLRCALIRRDQHAEKGIVPMHTIADYDRERDLLLHGWVDLPSTEVLILSESERDTLRDFLREHVNLEGQNSKRRAWVRVEEVKTNLRRWFYWRVNQHNRTHPESDWLDGEHEFEGAKKAWKQKNGDWHIPKDLIVPTAAIDQGASEKRHGGAAGICGAESECPDDLQTRKDDGMTVIVAGGEIPSKSKCACKGCSSQPLFEIRIESGPPKFFCRLHCEERVRKLARSKGCGFSFFSVPKEVLDCANRTPTPQEIECEKPPVWRFVEWRRKMHREKVGLRSIRLLSREEIRRDSGN